MKVRKTVRCGPKGENDTSPCIICSQLLGAAGIKTRSRSSNCVLLHIVGAGSFSLVELLASLSRHGSGDVSRRRGISRHSQPGEKKSGGSSWVYTVQGLGLTWQVCNCGISYPAKGASCLHLSNDTRKHPDIAYKPLAACVSHMADHFTKRFAIEQLKKYIRNVY